jgi:hypothetical protein
MRNQRKTCYSTKELLKQLQERKKPQKNQHKWSPEVQIASDKLEYKIDIEIKFAWPVYSQTEALGVQRATGQPIAKLTYKNPQRKSVRSNTFFRSENGTWGPALGIAAKWQKSISELLESELKKSCYSPYV